MAVLAELSLSWCLFETHSLTWPPPVTVCVCVCAYIFFIRGLLWRTAKGNTDTQTVKHTQPAEWQSAAQLMSFSFTFCLPSTAEKMFIKWPLSWSVWHGTLSVHWHPPLRGRHVSIALFRKQQWRLCWINNSEEVDHYFSVSYLVNIEFVLARCNR